ncbi:MAG: hypothetical protein DRH93_02495 [Deltaproteobacteria bacterium]|nr:MAG: hypothetical protein DRH93_02495 [Deltaproteobacteria bacterium]
MMPKLKNILLLSLAVGFVFLIVACDDKPQAKKKAASNVVAGKISQPVIQNKAKKEDKKNAANPKNAQIAKIETVDQVSQQKTDNEKGEHYDSKGKIDPFKPLIQDKSEESRPVVDKRPKRILTPLEKIELSQIRLVAIIIMEKKQIAMVEEANGKGYEVGIGTYIGKNQGRVSEIHSSSIVIKELVQDYKGRLKERVQEIKLHKIDNEE